MIDNFSYKETSMFIEGIKFIATLYDPKNE
jgi:hypothetical protein